MSGLRVAECLNRCHRDIQRQWSANIRLQRTLAVHVGRKESAPRHTHKQQDLRQVGVPEVTPTHIGYRQVQRVPSMKREEEGDSARSKLDDQWAQIRSSLNRSYPSKDVSKLIDEQLRQRKPRRALLVFRTALQHPGEDFTSEVLSGLIWHFFRHQQPQTGLDAVQEVYDCGFRLPARSSIRILSNVKEGFSSRTDLLEKLLNWTAEDLVAGKDCEDKGSQMAMLSLLMEIARRQDKPEWMVNILSMWRGKNIDFVGDSKLWGLVIRAYGASGKLEEAHTVFESWRERWLEYGSGDGKPPPEEAYVAYLLYCLRHSPIEDPQPYNFVSLFAFDGVPMSRNIHNVLLELEMTRHQSGSFWAIWHLMSTNRWGRNERSWKLATKMRICQLQGKIPRHGPSPLQTEAGYEARPAPPDRELLSEYLKDHATRGPYREPRPLVLRDISTETSTSSLNAFLKLFIESMDWLGAAVLLNLFTHLKIEPDEQTHSILVIGVVDHWRARRLELEEAELLTASATKSSKRDVEEGFEVLRLIIAKRRMRVDLWTQTFDGDTVQPATGNAATMPEWMRSREMRDVDYLQDLLRRCAGYTPDTWTAKVLETEREVLPFIPQKIMEVDPSLSENTYRA